MRVAFELNGAPVSVECAPEESLLDVLRERCGVRSPKDGCAPQGQCGCCMALVDGRPKTTCAIPAAKVEGRRVVTLEGIPEEDRELLARAFIAATGIQCGFCTPGIAIHAFALAARGGEVPRGEIAKEIDVHLCRCTGYVKVLDAVELYLGAKRGDGISPHPKPLSRGERGLRGIPELDPSGRVGASPARIGARETALGERAYVDDLRFPGMLHGALVLSAHPRARVLAIDADAAARLPGVIRIVTAADVPGERRYGLIHRDWPGLVAAGETTSSAGDAIALVLGATEREARAGAAAVRVRAEVLEPVLDPEAALEPGAPRVNPAHERNLLSRSAVRRGDADRALAASAHVVTGTWRTQRIEHLFLETEAAVAVPLAPSAGSPARLRLYTQGQGIFDDRRQVARYLALPEEAIEVELVPSGGAFGGKEDISVQAHAALLAHLAGAPVKVALSREESVRIHPKRHPITMRYTVGCDADGRLTAVKARMVGDKGAYASVGEKVLERAAGHACGAYRVPNVDVEALAVLTNNPPCGAMRGFGTCQAQFAMEGAVDLLAEKAKLDRFEIRLRNALETGDRSTGGQVLRGVGLKRTLEAVRPAYEAARLAGRAVGIACGMKSCGLGNGASEWGKARLRVEKDGTVTLFTGYTEMGQGLFTVLAEVACEVTGIPIERFRVRADSEFQLDCGQTTGSRATFYGGLAVKSAAEKLRAALDSGRELADLAGEVFAADLVDRSTTPLGADVPEPKTNPTFGYATQVVILDAAGRIERVIAAHDVGRAIHPRLCEGQIEGAVVMGLGYALTEELACEGGVPATAKLREIGALRARDVPEIEVILIEEPDPDGPFGAKGLGEIGLVPTAGAVAGALAAFDGVRRFGLPMRDSAAARAMHVGHAHGHGREDG